MAGIHLSATEAALEGQRIGPLQLRVAAICLLAQTFDGYDLSSISMAAPALSQAWHLPGAAFANTFVMSSVGIMVGALSSGPIGDRLGRKPVLLASLLLLAVSSLACVYATTVPVLAALRFVTGLGIGTLMPATVSLTSDYLPERLRATMIMIVFTGAPLGGFLGGQL
ncbi:MAG TPA: MFS transporter, partial [Rhodopila sp.]